MVQVVVVVKEVGGRDLEPVECARVGEDEEAPLPRILEDATLLLQVAGAAATPLELLNLRVGVGCADRG